MATKTAGPQRSNGVPLDRALAKLQEWQEAAKEARVATAKADRLKEEFRAYLALTGQDEASVRGYKVLTYTPTAGSYRGADFVRERPDLVDHYTRKVVKDEIDWGALKRDLPKVHDEYQTRTLRPDWRALETILAMPVEPVNR